MTLTFQVLASNEPRNQRYQFTIRTHIDDHPRISQLCYDILQLTSNVQKKMARAFLRAIQYSPPAVSEQQT